MAAPLLAVEGSAMPARTIPDDVSASRDAWRAPASHSPSTAIESALLNDQSTHRDGPLGVHKVGSISTSLLIRLVERIDDRLPHRVRDAASTVPLACVWMESVNEPLDPSP